MKQKLGSQATRFGADLRYGTITTVDLSQPPFRLLVDQETPLLAQAVIIATGASAQYLGLPNERRLLGHGVSACATCDGAFFRGDTVAVVGGGDTVMEEALFLTRFATMVYVIHRRDQLRASKIMQERAFAHAKIEFIWDTVVTDVLGEQRVTGMALHNRKTNEASELAVGGVFIAIGHKPNTEVFQGWLDMDAQGYIRTCPGSTYTAIPGVFACGDAQDHVYRQAVTAAGTGCMAAIDAERWLAAHGIISAPRTETEYHRYSLTRVALRYSCALCQHGAVLRGQASRGLPHRSSAKSGDNGENGGHCRIMLSPLSLVIYDASSL